MREIIVRYKAHQRRYRKGRIQGRRNPFVQREAQLVEEGPKSLASLRSEVPSGLVALVRERAKRTLDMLPIEK